MDEAFITELNDIIKCYRVKIGYLIFIKNSCSDYYDIMIYNEETQKAEALLSYPVCAYINDELVAYTANDIVNKVVCTWGFI